MMSYKIFILNTYILVLLNSVGPKLTQRAPGLNNKTESKMDVFTYIFSSQTLYNVHKIQQNFEHLDEFLGFTERNEHF